MSSFTTYLNKIQDLTQKNLDILNLINDSLYANQLHGEAMIDGTTYSIPSFLYIENKLNDLEANFKRLVEAPKTGTAAFVFDDKVRQIILQGYETSPESVDATRSDELFYVEKNNIFKDFVSPLIYIKYNLENLPNNINKVSVRKVIIRSSSVDLTEYKGSISWIDMNALLSTLSDTDYEMYDTTYDLPVRYNDVEGKFIITKDSKRYIDDNQYWIFTLDDIRYTYNNGSLKKNLQVGDIIFTDSDRCNLSIIKIDTTTNKVTAKVIGGYDNINTVEYFRYWKSDSSYKDQKYIKVPLEEDNKIVIFVAPINPTLNVQAPWGSGQIVDVDNLTDVNGNKFRDIYNTQIRNIGDVLYDITKFYTTSLSNVSESVLSSMTSYVPSLGDYQVILLNEHLLDNAAVEYVRKLNVQKAQINNDLRTIQDNIDKINTTLATTDFSSQDVTTRRDLENALKEYNQKRSQSLTNLSNIINQITLASKQNTLPTSSSKYVITGGIDTDSIENTFSTTSRAKVIRLEILYRYKNIDKDASNATTVSSAVTVSDWQKYIIDYRQKVAKYENGEMTYSFEGDNEDSTSGRWRTYQIPITRGETVDVMFRVQYDLGYPYVSLYSAWSEVTNVAFPDNLIKDVDIADIIDTNTEDARENMVKRELNAEGVTDHVSDKLIDQDVTYYHRPDSIASGFYTEDSKRIISLKEKLFEMNNIINELNMSDFGNNYKRLSLVASIDGLSYTLLPDQSATDIILPNYDELNAITDTEGNTLYKEAYPILSLTNTSNYAIRLYSMYPGGREFDLDENHTTSSKYYKQYSDYEKANIYISTSNSSGTTPQRMNQWIYFRRKSPYSSSNQYSYEAEWSNTGSDDNSRMSIIPITSNISNFQIEESTPGSYTTIEPGESLSFMLMVKCLKQNGMNEENVDRLISFDVWTSPWRDPLIYTARVIIPFTNKLSRTVQSIKNSGYKPISI